MPNPIFEVCVDSVDSAVAAEQGGATRVELCAALLEGGLTPSAGTIAITRAQVSIGLQVMIRPRGGDFLYSDTEFASMKHDIELAKQLGSNGVVFGLLTAAGDIDSDRTRVLLDLAKPMHVTFHRAFDTPRDPIAALETLIELGINCVLTSGQEVQHWRALNYYMVFSSTLTTKSLSCLVVVLPNKTLRKYSIRQAQKKFTLQEPEQKTAR